MTTIILKLFVFITAGILIFSADENRTQERETPAKISENMLLQDSNTVFGSISDFSINIQGVNNSVEIINDQAIKIEKDIKDTLSVKGENNSVKISRSGENNSVRVNQNGNSNKVRVVQQNP